MVSVGSVEKVSIAAPVAMSRALRSKAGDAATKPDGRPATRGLIEIASGLVREPAPKLTLALPSLLVAVPPLALMAVGGVRVAVRERTLVTTTSGASWTT